MQCKATSNRGGPCNGQWFTDMEILKDGFQDKKVVRKEAWILVSDDDDDELMLNVLRCHLTY